MGRRKNNPDLVNELIDGRWTMDQDEFPLSGLELTSDLYTVISLDEWQECQKVVREAEAAVERAPSDETKAFLEKAQDALAYQELNMQSHDSVEEPKTREDALENAMDHLSEDEAPELYMEYRALMEFKQQLEQQGKHFISPPYSMKYPQDWYDT